MKALIFCLLLISTTLCGHPNLTKTSPGVSKATLWTSHDGVNNYGNVKGSILGAVSLAQFHEEFGNEYHYTAGCHLYDTNDKICKYCGEGAFLHEMLCFKCTNNSFSTSGFKGSCYYDTDKAVVLPESNQNESQWKAGHRQGLSQVIIDGYDDVWTNWAMHMWKGMKRGAVVVDTCIYNLSGSAHDHSTGATKGNGENWDHIKSNWDSRTLGDQTYWYNAENGHCENKPQTSANKLRNCHLVAGQNSDTCIQCWPGYKMNGGECQVDNSNSSLRYSANLRFNSCQFGFWIFNYSGHCYKPGQLGSF